MSVSASDERIDRIMRDLAAAQGEDIAAAALEPKAFAERMVAGRRWSARLSPPPGRLFVLVGIALLLAALVGSAIVGGRLASKPPLEAGVIAFTTGTWSWADGPNVDGLAIAMVSSGSEPTRLVDVPGEPLPNWHVHEPLAGQDIRIGPAVRWSPDGARLAFRLYNDQAGIYVMSPDGSGLHLVAAATGRRSETTDQWNSSFTWAPDSARIAFVSPDIYPSTPDAAANGRLYVVDVDTGDVRELGQAANGSVAWSPDGSTIAFGRSHPRTSSVVLIDADGTGERSFEYGDLPRNHPGPIAWSPDGSRLAFIHTRFGGVEEGQGDYLMVVDPDGTNPEEVAYAPMGGCCYHGAYGGLIEWSPDGRLIGVNGGTIVAADGSGERLSLPGHFFDWSPDGSQLVYSGPGPAIPGAPGNRSTSIYVVDADGTNRQWLANGDYPAWSP